MQRVGGVDAFCIVALYRRQLGSLLAHRPHYNEEPQGGGGTDNGDGCPWSDHSLYDAQEIRPVGAGPGCLNVNDGDVLCGHDRCRDDDCNDDAASAAVHRFGGVCRHYQGVSASYHALDLDVENDYYEDWADGAIRDYGDCCYWGD